MAFQKPPVSRKTPFSKNTDWRPLGGCFETQSLWQAHGYYDRQICAKWIPDAIFDKLFDLGPLKSLGVNLSFCKRMTQTTAEGGGKSQFGVLFI